MITNQMTVIIGGTAGDGVESSGAGFCKALARGGLHVFGLPDYYSRIRGGHWRWPPGPGWPTTASRS